MHREYRPAGAFWALLLSTSWPPATCAQQLTRDTFPAVYRQHEDDLYRKYVFNRRVKYRQVDDAPHLVKGQRGEPRMFVVVTGENATRANSIADPSAKTPLELTGDLILPDQIYNLRAGNEPGTYRIGAHRANAGKGRHGTAFGANPTTYPVRYMDAVTDSSMSAILDSVTGGGSRHTLVAVRSATWHGQPAVEVTFGAPYGIINKVYLDAGNDYAFLGFESNGSPDPKTGKKGGGKVSGRVTYRPSDEGFPLPAKFELTETAPNGRRVRYAEVTVLEYERYRPTADDFDLEKQFGVKPLPPPGNGSSSSSPSSARRSWWWLYAAAGALAAVTAGLVVTTRRRAARAAAGVPAR